MSLRAIKKRETRPYRKHPAPNREKKFIEVQEKQPPIRRSKSVPDLKVDNSKATGLTKLDSKKRLSRSDSNVSKLAQKFEENANLISAKSEVCLKTISVHRTVHGNMSRETQSERNYSAAAASRHDLLNNNQIRRMSEQSLSIFSNPSSILTPSEYESRGFVDNSCVRIPIVGYEVMEERARFTVYKLRVENPFTNDCWLVLRRYTDFVRLNNKIKQLFPNINLQLPRKKLFGDNFNTVFLDNRAQGLQMFVNSIMSNEALRNCKVVREFFCLDEPPTYSESMEECRAIFEAQEETIAHLKMQINSKNDLILSLQQKLRNEIADKEQLKLTVSSATSGCAKCSQSISSSLGTLSQQSNSMTTK